MDHDVGLGPQTRQQQLLHGVHMPMRLGQGHVAGQDQVQVHVDAPAGLDRAQAVDVDPGRLPVFPQQRADLFQQRRVGFDHKSRNGAAHEPHTGPGDVDPDQTSDQAVEPEPARGPDQPQGHEHAGGGVDVGQHVLAVGFERQRPGAAPLAHEIDPEPQVDAARGHEQGDAAAEVGHGLGMEDLVPGLVENADGREQDEHALEPGGVVFDVAVAVGVALVGRRVGHGDAHHGKGRGHDVDDGFQGVGEDGRGPRQEPGRHLDDQ